MGRMQVDKTEISALIREARGSYIEAYRLLVAKREEEAISVERSTVAQRKQVHRTAIQHGDENVLNALDEKFVTAIEQINKNEIVLEPGRTLTQEEAHGLMREWLDQRDMAEFLAARLQMIKEVVSTHVTAEHARDGDVDPEHQNGSIAVSDLGYRFSKERCGRKDSKVNEKKLQELLGDDWESVCEVEEVPRKIIPKHKDYTFSPEKMMRLAQKDPKALEKLIECLEVGGWKNPVIMVRPIS